MSKIFIVQPHKMLRHAFAVAVSPDHEIETSKTMPAPADLQGSDLAIVDAASLRECGSLTASALNAVQSWKIPTIWIDNDLEIQAPARDKLLRLKAPFDKETLKKTVAQCLEQSGANQPAPKTKNRATSPAPSKVKPPEAKSSQSAADAEKKFIELVDIVE
jgi:DNA-binding LytR/AlgR family response regulator